MSQSTEQKPDDHTHTEVKNDGAPTDIEQEVTLYGNTEECGHCKDADKDFTNLTKDKKTKYRYVNIHETECQEYLKKKGIKPQEKVPIPQIKVCKTEFNKEKNKKERKCGEVSDYEPAKWKSLENDLLPEEVSLNLEE